MSGDGAERRGLGLRSIASGNRQRIGGVGASDGRVALRSAPNDGPRRAYDADQYSVKRQPIIGTLSVHHMHRASRNEGRVGCHIVQAEGIPVRLFEERANPGYFVNFDARDHEAKDMLAISSDPIVPSGFGIVEGFGKLQPDKFPEPRRIGNGSEQSSDGRAIAGFDHRFENENVPGSLHSRTWYFVSLAAILTDHRSFYEIRCDSFGIEPLK